MPRFLTLAPENQFQFVCPVFNAKTKMAACSTLRDRVFAGAQPAVRKGCQAAVRCSMCPAAEIVRRISYGVQTSDDYGSTEPKVGKIHAVVLDKMKNTIPILSVLDQIGVSPEERQLLLTSRTRIAEQLKTAPGRDGKETPFIAPQKINPYIYSSKPVSKRRQDEDETDLDMTIDATVAHRAPPKSQNTTINRAAMTGDMSAAINAAA